ncbi:26S proteasome regulatory subunit 10B, partial [Geodia barretti]
FSFLFGGCTENDAASCETVSSQNNIERENIQKRIGGAAPAVLAPSGLPRRSAAMTESERRQKSLEDYRKRLIDHRELDSKLKKMREELKEMTKEFDKSEEDLKALQSGVGQIVGEVLRQLTEDKFIVKASNGPRYVVGCRRQVYICMYGTSQQLGSEVERQ